MELVLLQTAHEYRRIHALSLQHTVLQLVLNSCMSLSSAHAWLEVRLGIDLIEC